MEENSAIEFLSYKDDEGDILVDPDLRKVFYQEGKQIQQKKAKSDIFVFVPSLKDDKVYLYSEKAKNPAPQEGKNYMILSLPLKEISSDIKEINFIDSKTKEKVDCLLIKGVHKRYLVKKQYASQTMSLPETSLEIAKYPIEVSSKGQVLKKDGKPRFDKLFFGVALLYNDYCYVSWLDSDNHTRGWERTIDGTLSEIEENRWASREEMIYTTGPAFSRFLAFADPPIHLFSIFNNLSLEDQDELDSIDLF